jgi:hypothetical protein
VRGEVRSSVRVRRDLLGWRPAAEGESEIAQALARFWLPGDFVVSVPGLGFIMLARRKGDRLIFVPVFDSDLLPRLKVGSEQAAQDVVELLAPLARKTDERLPG